MGINTKTIAYSQIVSELLKALNEREQEVLVKRYALTGDDKATLEEIGRAYNITRERVRQIENEALKKVRQAAEEAEIGLLNELNSLANSIISQYGGFIGQNHLIDELLHTEDVKEKKSLEFVLDTILNSKYHQVEEDNFDTIWMLDKNVADQVVAAAKTIADLIEKNAKPIKFDDLIGECKTCTAFPVIEKLPGENHFILEAMLKARTDMKQNILEQWGKHDWTTIKPKRMTDKAYLIMLREGRPLHFEECADLINKANFDKKKACAATVHNELILDEKYVLVGRGIYALRDWGYEDGTVGDIIAKILKEKGPLDKKQLSEEVLKQRMVQKTTITLALMNKDRFGRTQDGKYTLVK